MKKILIFLGILFAFPALVMATTVLPYYQGGTGTSTKAAAGDVLTWNGSGWKGAPASGGGGTPGGSDTQIQYNNSGSFAGNGYLRFLPQPNLNFGEPTLILGDDATTSISLQVSGNAAGSNYVDFYGQNFDGSADFDISAATSSGGGTYIDLFDDKGEIFLSPTRTSFILGSSNFAYGTSAPMSMFQVTASTTNATTSMEIGKVGQTKGTCLIMYDAVGAKKYISIQAGVFVLSNTSCK